MTSSLYAPAVTGQQMPAYPVYHHTHPAARTQRNQGQDQSQDHLHPFKEYPAGIKAVWLALTATMVGTLIFLLYGLPRQRGPENFKHGKPAIPENPNPVWTYLNNSLGRHFANPAASRLSAARMAGFLNRLA